MPSRQNNAAAARQQAEAEAEAARQQAEAEAEAARQQAEGQPAANVVLAQRAAAAATELLAKKKLELLRNKIKDDFQKALTSHGKLDSKGENAQKLERSLGLSIGDRLQPKWLEPAPLDPLDADVVNEGGQAEAQAAAQDWREWRETKEDRESLLCALYRGLVFICIEHEPMSDILSEIDPSDGAKAWKEFQLFFVNRTNGGHAAANKNFYAASMCTNNTSHYTNSMTVLEFIAHLHQMRRAIGRISPASRPSEGDCVATLLAGLLPEFLALKTSINAQGLQNLKEVERKIREFATNSDLLELTGSGRHGKEDAPNVFSAEEEKAVCRNWKGKGCTFGTNCRFSHTGEGKLAPRRVPPPRGQKTCYNCGGKGHLKNDCPSPSSDSALTVQGFEEELPLPHFSFLAKHVDHPPFPDLTDSSGDSGGSDDDLDGVNKWTRAEEACQEAARLEREGAPPEVEYQFAFKAKTNAIEHPTNLVGAVYQVVSAMAVLFMIFFSIGPLLVKGLKAAATTAASNYLISGAIIVGICALGTSHVMAHGTADIPPVRADIITPVVEIPYQYLEPCHFSLCAHDKKRGGQVPT